MRTATPTTYDHGTAYARADHRPNDPAVRKGYASLVRYLDAWYRETIREGYRFAFVSSDPYASLAAMAADHAAGRPVRIWTGSDGSLPADHPMAETVGQTQAYWTVAPLRTFKAQRATLAPRAALVALGWIGSDPSEDSGPKGRGALPFDPFASDPASIDAAIRFGKGRGRATLDRFIRAHWDRIIHSAAVVDGPHATIIRPMFYAALPDAGSPLRILGTSAKIDKGLSVGVRAVVAYLSPATESGVNLCAFASAGCAAACLGHAAGRMVFTANRNARLWRSALYLGARAAFAAVVSFDVSALVRRAENEGTIPAVRLDGSTDLGFGARLAPHYPGVRFWDYTKNPGRAAHYARGGTVHVTFSRSETNGEDVTRVLETGAPVAVVFDADPLAPEGSAAWSLPETYQGYRVVDGDRSDARFLDRDAFGIPEGTGYVVGLRFKAAKGRARAVASAIRSGFVVARDA